MACIDLEPALVDIASRVPLLSSFEKPIFYGMKVVNDPAYVSPYPNCTCHQTERQRPSPEPLKPTFDNPLPHLSENSKNALQ